MSLNYLNYWKKWVETLGVVHVVILPQFVPSAYQYHVHRKQQPLLDITLASIIIFAIKCRHSHFHVLPRAQRGKARRDNSYSNKKRRRRHARHYDRSSSSL